MQRREFIVLAGGVAAWPLAARAQQPDRVRRIGMLIAVAESDPVGQRNAAIFRQSLQELGWPEGRRLSIERRWAGGDVDRSRNYATELVSLELDLIVAVGTPSVAALKQATRSIPVVFAIVNDPVAQGFIASMAHPDSRPEWSINGNPCTRFLGKSRWPPIGKSLTGSRLRIPNLPSPTI